MEFFGALNVAEIYLDSDMSKVMHAVLGTLRKMTTSIGFAYQEFLKPMEGMRMLVFANWTGNPFPSPLTQPTKC